MSLSGWLKSLGFRRREGYKCRYATLKGRADTKTDLKVHLVWVPKYRKKALAGEVAIRVRDVLKQIAMEHDLEVISGKVATDHVHMFIGYNPSQDISKIVQWLKGISSRVGYCCRSLRICAGSFGAGTYGHGRDIWQ